MKDIINSLAEAIEIAEPYDETTHSKEVLTRVLKGNPSFEEKFQSQLTDKFRQSVKEKGLFFIINYEKKDRETSIRLGYCKEEEIPTISLNIGKEETYF